MHNHFTVVSLKGESQAEHFTPSHAPCGTACEALNSGTTWPHMVLLLQAPDTKYQSLTIN